MKTTVTIEGVSISVSFAEYAALRSAVKSHSKFSTIAAKAFTGMPMIGSTYACKSCKSTFPADQVHVITMGKQRPVELEVCPICDGHDINLIK